MNYELETLAQTAAPQLEPAELHGTVCGMAAARPMQFELPALVDLLGTDVLSDTDSVQAFVAATLDEYFAQDMEFQALIPDDDTPLAQRIVGLATWCAGFLSGFGAACAVPYQSLADEIQELIRDFISISGLSEDEEESDHNEASLMEVYEYVRVGAVLALAIMLEEGGEAADEDEGPTH